MTEQKHYTPKSIIKLFRRLIALRLLDLALDVAPEDDKNAYAVGVLRILSELKAKAAQPLPESNLDSPQVKPISYYPERFWNICVELGLDPQKVVDPEDSLICALIQGFVKGEIDEVQVMRTLRNLDIFNNGKWAKVG